MLHEAGHGPFVLPRRVGVLELHVLLQRAIVPFGITRATRGKKCHDRGIVSFAHGSVTRRHSPRNRYVARTLERRGFATL